MTLSELSIRRPVLASVVSLLIIVAGLASLNAISVRELPDVDSSVVSITTTSSRLHFYSFNRTGYKMPTI